jgi:RNA-directed DNA polymerase
MKEVVDRQDAISQGGTGEGGTGSGPLLEQQTSVALNETEDLTTTLMEQICDCTNLNRAYKRVKANKGAPGSDGMTVQELGSWLNVHKEQLIHSLLDGRYRPWPVRSVDIPKGGSGDKKRQLGIPCVVDRLVQQAIHQVLEPLFEPEFSASSFGFRPGRKAHDAVRQARDYVDEGRVWVVDLDLEQFFDRVNHDILMSRLTRKIQDKRLLKLIRRFLEAGMLRNGVRIERHEGAPQGGPLSPLLSNVLLDELDQELERRGHKFCRYADDVTIYVKSKRAGERVYGSVKRFLETKLKLRVSDQKSAVGLTRTRQFLGYRLQVDGQLSLSPEAKRRAKDKIRQLTSRSRGQRFETVVRELNEYLRGWLNYYQLVDSKSLWRELDSWIRHKLRCYKLKQKKRGFTLAKYLMSLGVAEKQARQLSSSGKGWWRLSRTHTVHQALNKRWFEDQGLIELESRWASLFDT